MNNPNEPNTSSGNAKSDDTRRNNFARPANGNKADPKEAAQEEIHQVTPKDDVKKYTPTPVKAPGMNPPAGKGNEAQGQQKGQQERHP